MAGGAVPRSGATRAKGSRLEKVSILGILVDPLTLTDLLEAVRSLLAGAEPRTLMYLNVHVANLAASNERLRQALLTADIVYCDGAGVKLGAKLLGGHLPQRMTGADFVWDLAAQFESQGTRLFWLGGAPGVASRAMAQLQKKHPQLQVAGTQHGYFDKSAKGTTALLEQINCSGADVVFVGMGSPAQELWVAQHRQALHAKLVWCIGATADVLAGEVPRAPEWMREAGMEWLFRFAVEPRRLFTRYIIGNPRFLARVVSQRWRR